LQLYSCAAVRDVANVASKDAALLVKKQQSTFRDHRSGGGSSFDHKTSIEGGADPFFAQASNVGHLLTFTLGAEDAVVLEARLSGECN
jgi:hypothetical protein